MALAQPRRREKWGVNLNGKSWSNDQDKLGLKMMQKLGYESGKGLGKNKDGIIAPITARQKMDSKGIGFNGHDDTWLAHQDDFQAVLASLNVEHGNSEAQEAGKKSLEKLSKKSKKRVHYQKFTRGKDLANYSIDDLGCILGTKSEKLKNMQKEKKEAEEKKLEEETADKKPETKHGVMTLQGGNYHDYFQKKMALLKAKGLPTFEGSKIKQENSDEDNDCTASFNVNHIKVGERKPTSILQDQPPLLSVKQEPAEVPPAPISTDDSPEEEPTPKKKKKSKKEKKEKESDEQIVTADKENAEDSSDTSEKSSKKKKKSKEMIDLKEELEPVAQEKSEKKKKKKKDKSKDVEEEMIVKEEVLVQEVTKKKKNKKQEKEQIEEVSAGDRKRSHEEVEQEAEEPSKKRKKNKKEKKCAEETPEKSANELVKSLAKSDKETATLSAKQTMDDLFNPVLKKMKEVKSVDSIPVAEESPKSAKKSKKSAEKATESAENSAEKSGNVLSNESAVLAMRSNFHSVNRMEQSEDHYLKSAFSALKQSAVIKS